MLAIDMTQGHGSGEFKDSMLTDSRHLGADLRNHPRLGSVRAFCAVAARVKVAGRTGARGQGCRLSAVMVRAQILYILCSAR